MRPKIHQWRGHEVKSSPPLFPLVKRFSDMLALKRFLWVAPEVCREGGRGTFLSSHLPHIMPNCVTVIHLGLHVLKQTKLCYAGSTDANVSPKEKAWSPSCTFCCWQKDKRINIAWATMYPGSTATLLKSRASPIKRSIIWNWCIPGNGRQQLCLSLYLS